MIKYLFILVNSLTLFIFGLFSGDGGITVTSNIPNAMKPGQEVPIEITVSKGNMSGFAKLQLDLPAGFSVKEIDNKGANYSYVEGTAKWVWASLPTEADLIVKCTLIAASDASGVKTIGAKYSYVENNGKKVVEMTPVEVTVGDNAVASNTSTPTETTVPTNTTETTANSNTETTTPTYTQANTNSEPTGNIIIKRTIIPESNEGEYTVKIKINKGLTKGFARYSDDLPMDVVAKAGKSEGSSFSVSDGKIKFVWVTVPEQEELEISYSLFSVNRTIALNGEYSYLEQNQSKTYNVSPEKITVESTDAANNNSTTSTPTVANVTPTVASETPTVANETPTVAVVTPTENPVNSNTTDVVNNTNTTTPTTPTETPVNETLPKNDGNINYMVQIGAFTNSAVGASKLSRKFNISENIKSEMAGGFSKFMVGSHTEYKNARDHREKIRNNNRVGSAFVVAYNTGKRITVQEALMISNQKWFR